MVADYHSKIKTFLRQPLHAHAGDWNGRMKPTCPFLSNMSSWSTNFPVVPLAVFFTNPLRAKNAGEICVAAKQTIGLWT